VTGVQTCALPICRLAPFVCTLPVGSDKSPTKINVNTAELPVLLSLSSNVDRTKLEAFIARRRDEPAKNLQELQKDGTLPPDVTPDLVDVKTQFFLMRAEAFIGSGRVALYSVLQRAGSGAPLVIARSLDTE
jgi:general secretion pathway protein K